MLVEGDKVAQTLRGLELDPAESQPEPSSEAARAHERAQEFLASADDFESYWYPPGSGEIDFAGTLSVSKLLGGRPADNNPIPRPVWRQYDVRTVEARMGSLRKRRPGS